MPPIPLTGNVFLKNILFKAVSDGGRVKTARSTDCISIKGSVAEPVTKAYRRPYLTGYLGYRGRLIINSSGWESIRKHAGNEHYFVVTLVCARVARFYWFLVRTRILLGLCGPSPVQTDTSDTLRPVTL